jgi:hypothetical protein
VVGGEHAVEAEFLGHARHRKDLIGFDPGNGLPEFHARAPGLWAGRD